MDPGGEVPGVTRVPANSVMPPGMAGKKDFQVDGEQITYDPEKSKELLAEAGYGDEPFPITMVYYEVDPLAVAGQKQVTKGFEAGGFKVKAIPVQESPYNIWLDPDNKVNKTLNLRGVTWCSDWPAGSTMLPPLLKDVARSTTPLSSTSRRSTRRWTRSTTLPLEEQADAWGALDEKIMTDYFPIDPDGLRQRCCSCSAARSATRRATARWARRTTRTSTSWSSPLHRTAVSPSHGWLGETAVWAYRVGS